MDRREFKFTQEHVWLCPESGKIGVTDYAQSQLGEIVFVDLSPIGSNIKPGDKLSEIESSKAVSTILSPVSGKIVEINQTVIESPQLVNQEPYDNGWLVRLEFANSAELDQLMSGDSYEKFIASLM